MPKIAIIQFPGSNCERETVLAVKRAQMEPIEFLWNEPKEKLLSCDGFIIVGGFSYEDRSRAGIIAALDPVMQILREQNQLGKPILGICNGAQILVESGLVPGIENDKPCMVLTDNKRIKDNKVLGTGFYNAWIHMRLSDQYQLNAFTRKLTPKNILNVPVAHAEGRFVLSEVLLNEIQVHGLNVFQYCDESGEVIDEFPINPNGSINNIAAISNKNGNVMAMMPHPERTPAGDAIFHSMREYIKAGFEKPNIPLHYYPRFDASKKFPKPKYEFLVELLITDNQAFSVENALTHLNINVPIKRYIHWEIQCDSDATFEKIKESGVLFNNRKEKILKSVPQNGERFLIRSKEDFLGKQKQQMLEDHFSISGIETIKHSIVWQIESKDQSTIDQILDSHILFNPTAHDCYAY